MTTSGTDLYEVYQRRRQELLNLAEEEIKIVKTLRMDETQTEGTKPGEIVAGLINRLENDTLRVLVIGRFSAGKSTFVNALFGQIILPASPTPTTGVLCEVKYADEKAKRAKLYPKTGMGKDSSSEPVEVRISNLQEELGRYVKIDHFGDATATSRYKKLELYWPLALCKNGVELIDSVGLDDPDAREEITMQYAKSADAILYCMKSQDAYSAKDKQVLGVLKSLGYESIFFVVTYYDHVRESVLMGETTEEEFRRLQSRNLAPWTELKENGIKYVDSKAALIGRMQGNQQAVLRSGIQDVESSLETFLTQQKGQAKLLTSLRSLRAVNRDVRAVIPSRIGMWQTSTAELEARYRDAEKPLQNLEQTRQLLVSNVQSSIKDICWGARDRAEGYFLDLSTKVKEWAEAYEIQTSFGFPPKFEPVVIEVMEGLKMRIEEDVAEWNRSVLLPMIEEKMREMEQSLEGHAQTFFEGVARIRIQISVGAQISSEEVTKQNEPSWLGRAVAGGYTLLTGDFLTGGTGLFLGIKAMMSTIIFQIIAGILLAIFGLLNPFAIVAAAIAAIAAGNITNLFMLKGRIKKTVGEKLSKEIDKMRRGLCDNVRDEVEKKLLVFRDALDQGLAGEISSVRGEVEAILEKRKHGRANAEREIDDLRQIESANLKLEERIEELIFEAGISSPASVR